MSKFSIGDRVRVRDYEDIPKKLKSSGGARMCGEIGTIEDVFYSEARQCDLYVIQFDNYETSSKLWFDEQLKKVDEGVTYDYEFEFLEKLVVARLYEIKEDSKTQIAKGHGHINNDGVDGIAQAATFALKRIQKDLCNRGKEDDHGTD